MLETNSTKAPRRRRGVSLLELTITLTIMAIMSACSVPSFRRAVEQSRADVAAANLRAIWSAERLYWLDHQAYDGSLEDLVAQVNSGGSTHMYLDPIVVISQGLPMAWDASKPAPAYVFAVSQLLDAQSFTATATRVYLNSSGQLDVDQTGHRWSGSMAITQSGSGVTGEINRPGESTISPSPFFQ